MSLRRATIVACLTASLGTGVAAGAHAGELTVSAAASLQNAFREIGRRFEQAHPGTTVRFNFAGSGPLLAQLRKGAPVDVFASADHDTMDRAVAEGLVTGATRRDFASNAVVLVAPLQAPANGAGASLSALADLRGARVRRIAVGQPRVVPAGAYTRRALQAQGLWSALEPRLVYGDNVRQVLSYVSRGEVDAGFVYRSDALLDAARVRIVLTVPTEGLRGGRTIVVPALRAAGASRTIELGDIRKVSSCQRRNVAHAGSPITSAGSW